MIKFTKSRKITKSLANYDSRPFRYARERFDGYRKDACDNAICAVRNYRVRIDSEEGLDVFFGHSVAAKLGPKTRSRITDVVVSGTIKDLGDVSELARTKIALQKVWGVGGGKAERLFHKGYRTVQDLLAAPEEPLLEDHQRAGLTHMGDIEARMPRQEAKDIVDYVQRAAETILPGAPAWWRTSACAAVARCPCRRAVLPALCCLLPALCSCAGLG